MLDLLSAAIKRFVDRLFFSIRVEGHVIRRGKKVIGVNLIKHLFNIDVAAK